MAKRESYRNVRTERYTQVSNSLLNDKQASLQAKGLLSIFLSNSEDWEIHMKEIITRSKNGRDAHYTAVNELIELGYIARIQIIDTVHNRFEEMVYLYSDLKQDVANEIENLVSWAEENKKLLKIAYQQTKEKETKKIPVTENQETGKKPYTDFQDAENEYTENQYNNNTKYKNTKNKNTKENLNLNLSVIDPYEILWNLQIPISLKNKIKIMINNQEISLTAAQLQEIEDAYIFQVQNGLVVPKCDYLDDEAINDNEFAQTVSKMLISVRNIENMKGLIKDWVQKAFTYKKEKHRETDYSDSNMYNWLEASRNNEEQTS